MKQRFLTLTLLMLTLMFISTPAFASNCHGQAKDNKIHTSNVQGFSLNYELIDMTENLKKLKGDHAAHKMAGTHHLMVMVKGPKDLKGAKVGFVLIDPDGKKHNAMAMAMGDGFGADLPMMKKGEYTIKTKLMKDQTKLMDEFTYHMH